MTFIASPAQLALLTKELGDSHQAVMASTGDNAGTITHDKIVASWRYAVPTLTVTLIEGGGWLVEKVIHSKIQAALDAVRA